MKNYASGLPAEEYFKDHEISMLLYRQQSNDERHKKIEGDFRPKDGSALIEVKTDRRCFSSSNPTGNIPIEIMNPGNPEGKGWFYHCAEDGVTDILFFCYRAANEPPYCFIKIDFGELNKYVTAKLNDSQYRASRMKKTQDDVENLCIPVKEILSIPRTRQFFPLDEKDAVHIIEKMLQYFGTGGNTDDADI